MSEQTCPRPAAADAPATTARRTLSRRAAFALQVSIVVSLLAGSIAPTPLYAHYREAWGFGASTTTVIFATYAIAVLAALLVVGRLSDHVGRRPVLLAAVLVQPVVMVLFATAGDVGTLIVARILQGLATGAALGAVGAGLVDLSRTHGATANAVAAPAGTATGSVLAGLLVGLAPAPDHLVFAVLLVVFALQAAGLVLMGETVTRAPGAVASLKPRFIVPRQVRGALAAAIPALVSAWALAGFYGSLGPAVVSRVTASPSIVLGSLGLAVMAGFGSAMVLTSREVSASTVMRAGTGLLALGVAATLPAIAASIPVLFFVAAAVAGVGFGGALSGAMRSVIPLAAPHERAGVISIVFVASYLAMGLPAVVAGLVLSRTGDLVETATGFGIVVVALALAALVLELRRAPATA